MGLYGQGAKYEVKAKLEMKQKEKKAAESCKKVLKKKRKDSTWCLIRYGGGG